MDKYDRMLLSALMENGRASYAELARKVNLSAPAVAERVAKLESSGVMTGYQATVHLAKVSLPIQCLIELRLTQHGNQKAYDEMIRIPQLTECHRVTGDDCYIATAYVRDVEHLERLIDALAEHGKTTSAVMQTSPVPRRALPPADTL